MVNKHGDDNSLYVTPVTGRKCANSWRNNERCKAGRRILIIRLMHFYDRRDERYYAATINCKLIRVYSFDHYAGET